MSKREAVTAQVRSEEERAAVSPRFRTRAKPIRDLASAGSPIRRTRWPTGLPHGQAITRGDVCDQRLLVCWDHSNIIRLLKGLGCDSREGCPVVWPSCDFESVVSVRSVLSLRSCGRPPLS